MKIDPLDQYHQEAFSVLRKLKHKSDLNRSNKVNYSIRFLPPKRELETSSTDLQIILKNFVRDNILRILDEYPISVGDEDNPKADFWGFDIELKRSNFNKYYNNYKKAFSLSRNVKPLIYEDGKTAGLPKNWGWSDKRNGKYQFGKKDFEQSGKIRKKVFVALMVAYEKTPQAIVTQTVTGMARVSSARLTIEIAAINNRLKDKIGYYFKGSGKGYYTLEKFTPHKSG